MRFPRHSSRTLASLACAILLLQAGCTRCGRFRDAYAEVLRQETASIGTGRVVDTGVSDHDRLTLSADAFGRAAGLLGEVEILRPATLQRVVDAGGARTGVSAELGARVIGVELLGGADGRAVGLVLETVISLRLDAPRTRTDFTTTTHRTMVGGQLRFVDVDELPTLLIDLTDAEILDLGLDLHNVPEAVAPHAEEVLRALLAEALREADARVTVITWDRYDLGITELALAASSLTVDAERGSVALGVVTNLRPRGLGPAGELPAPDDGYRFDMHADLPRAAAVQLAALGRIPRRFDLSGEPSLSGSDALTIESLEVHPDQVRLSLSEWTIDGGRCGGRALRGAAEVAVSGGQVRVTAGPLATADGEVVTAGRYGVFADHVAAVLSALFGPSPPALRAGMELRMHVESLTVDARAVTIVGRARPEERSLL